MTLNLKELYQEIILDHNRHPHHHYCMDDPTHQANGFNPLCGDKLTVYLKIKHDRVEDVSFLGAGCAISQASASLMTDAIIGKSVTEAHALFKRFHRMVTLEDDEVNDESLDKLAVLAGVRLFPARVKCATLAWHTLEAAFERDITTVKTE